MDTKKWINKVFITLVITGLGLQLHAQKNSEKLKQKQREIEKKIESTKELIGETKNRQRLSIAELAIINQQISYREELIHNISSQVRKLNQQIEENKSVIEAMNNDLVNLKEQYKKMVFYAYKHRNNYHKLMFVFAARDINQAYVRIKYIQQFGDYRKKQVEMIKKTQEDLEIKAAELEEQKNEKLGLAKTQESEKKNFEEDKSKQQVALTELQKEEKKLKQELTRQEEKRKQLAQQIKKAIEEEIREQQRIEAEKNKASKTKTKTDNKSENKTGYIISHEGKIESEKFENNKGVLPWPVEKGEVVKGYGKVPHATLANVWEDNPGIDIATAKGAKVRSVFDGTVSSIFVIEGAGKVVMVSHGAYRTVYANLADVSVKKGQKVTAKQNLGTLLPAEGNISEAHFELWHITEENIGKQNPLLWLYKN
ncbi:MAG: murein hydrolase activator EnvC family protein [Bacteroidota bacterium]